jgi:ATP-dependent Clp protease ATP-binding subunit ClpC
MASFFSFDPVKSTNRNALWFDSYFSNSALTKIRKGTQWIIAALLLAFLITFIARLVSEQTSRYLLALLLFAFAYGAAVFLLEHFGASLVNQKSSSSAKNLADNFSFETALLSTRAIKHAKKKKLPEINSLLLLHFAIKNSAFARFLFNRLLLDLKEFQKLVEKSALAVPIHQTAEKQPPFSADFKETILRAIALAKKQGRSKVEEEDLLSALAAQNNLFNTYLVERGLLPERDIPNIAQWFYRVRSALSERGKFWLKKNLRKYGTLAKGWAAGYAITLEQFAYDISKEVRQAAFPKAIGHDIKKKEIERTLSKKRSNNVLLVGNIGSGRKRLMQDFASKSILGEHRNAFLNYKRVLELDLPSLLAGSETQDEVEAILSQAFQEVIQSGNIILVIDNIHNFIGRGATAAPGSINIAGVLIPYLQNPNFPLIAITNYANFRQNLEQNPSFISAFDVVEIEELSQAQALSVLQEITPSSENTHGKFISYPALQTIVSYADKYIHAVPFPKKAIDLLDEALAYLDTTSEKILTPAHIATIVSERTQIPVGEIETSEQETLLNLEDLIHKRIVNQEEAVNQVSAALRRARTEISSRKGPMGSFLFLGPTGVGKTETAKALAAIYFGSENRMIRLDMSEFQSVKDIDRLLGTPEQQGLLVGAVREDPFSLLLLDELEKAHPDILHLFLQVLDEGNLTDGLGRKVDFSHTIIIATSNAGYQLIFQAAKEHRNFADLKAEVLDYIFQQGLYRPEFINRFDGVVLFRPLTQEHLLQIAELMLHKVVRNLHEKGIDFVITSELKEVLAKLGYNPTFGARNMRRVLQDKVENALAVALLSKKIKRGDAITVDPATFEVKKV